MCGIGLATKGVICQGREAIVSIGGGGIIYRDRIPPSKFRFPKVKADLIDIINEDNEYLSQIKITLDPISNN